MPSTLSRELRGDAQSFGIGRNLKPPEAGGGSGSGLGLQGVELVELVNGNGFDSGVKSWGWGSQQRL